jgi:hypothetical protein
MWDWPIEEKAYCHAMHVLSTNPDFWVQTYIRIAPLQPMKTFLLRTCSRQKPEANKAVLLHTRLFIIVVKASIVQKEVVLYYYYMYRREATLGLLRSTRDCWRKTMIRTSKS